MSGIAVLLAGLATVSLAQAQVWSVNPASLRMGLCSSNACFLASSTGPISTS